MELGEEGAVEEGGDADRAGVLAGGGGGARLAVAGDEAVEERGVDVGLVAGQEQGGADGLR